MTKIKLLSAEDIECRVQSSNEKGCSLLLYKDARVDMRILDEIFGINGWQRTHEVINGNLFCNIDIWDQEKKCWVRKQDVGIESKAEAEKGQASDAFKRAGFNIGIGRELYTAPFIWIVLSDSDFTTQKKIKTKFLVKEISYNERREIDRLIITDSKSNIRYEYGVSSEEKKARKEELVKKRIDDQLTPLTEELVHDVKFLSRLLKVEKEESTEDKLFNHKEFLLQYYKFDDAMFDKMMKVYNKYKKEAA